MMILGMAALGWIFFNFYYIFIYHDWARFSRLWWVATPSVQIRKLVGKSRHRLELRHHLHSGHHRHHETAHETRFELKRTDFPAKQVFRDFMVQLRIETRLPFSLVSLPYSYSRCRQPYLSATVGSPGCFCPLTS